eukprot:scaffold2513_cov47-Attheya_sp.AAC.3
MKAVFDESGTSFAEEFTDKVRGLHEHFDLNKDGFLNFEELRSLQLMTSGEDMKPEHYEMACRALDCHPSNGLSLDALRLTYAADGTSIDEDYSKVFRKKGKAKKKKRKAKKSSKMKDTNDDDDEVIYEVGEGGVDISD